jgi:hypothetical protein
MTSMGKSQLVSHQIHSIDNYLSVAYNNLLHFLHVVSAWFRFRGYVCNYLAFLVIVDALQRLCLDGGCFQRFRRRRRRRLLRFHHKPVHSI